MPAIRLFIIMKHASKEEKFHLQEASTYRTDQPPVSQPSCPLSLSLSLFLLGTNSSSGGGGGTYIRLPRLIYDDTRGTYLDMLM